jgi:Ca2+-transporting ATPase
MQRPPRAPSARLLSSSLIRWGLIQGSLALLVVAAVYYCGYRWSMPEADLRALTFIVLVCGNLGLVLVNRSFSAGTLGLLKGAPGIFYAISATVAVLLTVAIFWQPARKIFQFGAFNGDGLLVVFASLALLILALEAVKSVRPSRYQDMLAR